MKINLIIKMDVIFKFSLMQMTILVYYTFSILVVYLVYINSDVFTFVYFIIIYLSQYLSIA